VNTSSSKDHPHDESLPDQKWNADARGETPTERLDRNWNDLLQELRVSQTGVQLLTGFLLTLPFQARFAELEKFDRNVYLMAVSAAVLATGLLISPVMLHRFLFRRHARRTMVNGAHRLAMLGILFLAVSIVCVIMLIFDLVTGPTGGVVAAAVSGAFLLIMWAVVPGVARLRTPAQTSEPEDSVRKT
jgi:Family of unknown function (DUF6328)